MAPHKLSTLRCCGVCRLSANSNCCTACLQVTLSSEAASHTAAARAAVHDGVVEGEKEAAEAAALPQQEQMRSAAGFTGRLSSSRASAGVLELADAPAAGTAAAETQVLAAVDLPVLPEATHGQPPGAANFLWDAEPAAEQGKVAGTVSGLQPKATRLHVAEGRAALQHAQQPSSPALQQPRSQAHQVPGSAPVLMAASTAGQAAQPADAQSAEPEDMPAATEAAAHSPLATHSMPETLAIATSHFENPLCSARLLSFRSGCRLMGALLTWQQVATHQRAGPRRHRQQTLLAPYCATGSIICCYGP